LGWKYGDHGYSVIFGGWQVFGSLVLAVVAFAVARAVRRASVASRP
jgi:hypothetical protein